MPEPTYPGRPGQVARHIPTGKCAILDHRKTGEDARRFPGWWCRDGSGLADFVLYGDQWELLDEHEPLHRATVTIEWNPSASIGEPDAVRALLERWCGQLMEELQAMQVTDPTIELDVHLTRETTDA